MSDCFRISSGVKQGFIMSPWPFNVYKDTLMKVKMGMGRREESGGCLTCMQMTLFCVLSRRET